MKIEEMQITPTEEDIAHIEQIHGFKTINAIRADVGLPPVPNGEIPYVDWLRQLIDLPPTKIH